MKFISFEFDHHRNQKRVSKPNLIDLRTTIKYSTVRLEKMFENLDNNQIVTFKHNEKFQYDDVVRTINNLTNMQAGVNENAKHDKGIISSDHNEKNNFEANIQYTSDNYNGFLSDILKGNNDGESVKSGVIIASTTNPQNSSQYWCRRLVRKTNLSISNKYKSNSLKSIKLKLSCVQSDNSMQHTPPSIKNISAQLLGFTSKSKYAIPIALTSTFAREF